MGDLSVDDTDMEAADDCASLRQFWQTLMAGQEADAIKLYSTDAELRLPQTGEKLVGRAAIASHGILGRDDKLVRVSSLYGNGNIWVSECEGSWAGIPILMISVALMDDGIIVSETRYSVPMDFGRADKEHA